MEKNKLLIDCKLVKDVGVVTRVETNTTTFHNVPERPQFLKELIDYYDPFCNQLNQYPLRFTARMLPRERLQRSTPTLTIQRRKQRRKQHWLFVSGGLCSPR